MFSKQVSKIEKVQLMSHIQILTALAGRNRNSLLTPQTIRPLFPLPSDHKMAPDLLHRA